MAKQKREFEEVIGQICADADLSRITTFIDSLNERLDVVEKRQKAEQRGIGFWPSLDCNLTEEERNKL